MDQLSIAYPFLITGWNVFRLNHNVYREGNEFIMLREKLGIIDKQAKPKPKDHKARKQKQEESQFHHIGERKTMAKM